MPALRHGGRSRRRSGTRAKEERLRLYYQAHAELVDKLGLSPDWRRMYPNPARPLDGAPMDGRCHYARPDDRSLQDRVRQEARGVAGDRIFVFADR